MESIYQAFREGGPWMFAILFLQIASLAIIAERVYSLYVRRKKEAKVLVSMFEDQIKTGNLKGVIEKAKANNSIPVARAVEAGAIAAQSLGGQNEIQARMDEVLVEENAHLEARMGFLSMIGNVATLVGLLGTISGMIRSFAAVANASPMEKAALLAAGISEAMHATAYGLIVAIPALLAYAVLQNRSNVLAEDLNHAALKAFNWLSYSFENVPLKRIVKTQERTTQAEV